MDNPPSNAPHRQTPTTEQIPNFPQWPDWQVIIAAEGELPFDPFQIFENPFGTEDLIVFDGPNLHRLLHDESLQLSLEDLAGGLHGSSTQLMDRIVDALSPEERSQFHALLRHPFTNKEKQIMRRLVLDKFFWDLIYWKYPDLYDELTEGEQLHPSIFESLDADIRDRIVLDAGAGTGRATLECLRHGAQRVYAVDPSLPALRILAGKIAPAKAAEHVVTLEGCFERLPLENSSVDTSIACSAFQQNEAGLVELLRVTKPGGKIVLIWPKPNDYAWLAEHGFEYVSFPVDPDARVQFRSFESALRCVRVFYAGNQAAIDYLLATQQPEIPYTTLGFKQPSDYCWRIV